MRRWVIGVTVLLFLSAGTPVNHGQEKPLGPGDLYDAAMELYYQGKYMEAIEAFCHLSQVFPASRSVPYAVHMIGQCYLHLGKFDEALRQFKFYLETYPQGDRCTESQQGIQMAEEGQKEKGLPPTVRATVVPPSPPPAKPRKRRVCAQIFHLDAKDNEEVDKRLKDLKKAGINTVIVKAFQIKGDRSYAFVNPRTEEGVYFQTQHAPVVDDVFGTLAQMAHKNDLDIFAWMTTRYSDFGQNSSSERRCRSYNFGTRQFETGRGMTFFSPENVKRLEGLFRDLGRCPIDGILFQDDLMLGHNEDFSVGATKAFLKDHGFTPHPDILYVNPFRSDNGRYEVKGYTDRFWTWAHWKSRRLMEVGRHLMDAAQASHPRLQFGLNLYCETVLNPPQGLAWFSQNLGHAIEKDFDYYAVMAYHRQTMQELRLGGEKAADLMAEVTGKALALAGDPSRVMMKIQILDWVKDEIVPTREVEDILTRILGQGRVSLALVPYVDSFPFPLLKNRWNSR